MYRIFLKQNGSDRCYWFYAIYAHFMQCFFSVGRTLRSCIHSSTTFGGIWKILKFTIHRWFFSLYVYSRGWLFWVARWEHTASINPLIIFFFYFIILSYYFLTSYFVPGYNQLWRRKWQPTPVFLPGKSHGQRSLAGCSLWDRKESDKTWQLNNIANKQTMFVTVWGEQGRDSATHYMYYTCLHSPSSSPPIQAAT